MVNAYLQTHGPRLRAEGFWRDEVLDQHLARWVEMFPEKTAIVSYRSGGVAPRRYSYAALEDHVARAAGGLRALGIGKGDVVAIQLPNWAEFTIATLATWRLGATANPLMPIFRDNELRFMLGFADAKLAIMPRVFRGYSHQDMAARLRQDLPALSHVVYVDDPGADGWNQLLQHGSVRVDPGRAPLLGADDLAVLMYTSGTTGFPKGVMHTSNTLIANTYALAGRFGLTHDDILLGCSPCGHMTGFVAAMILSLRLGATLVLQDVWDGRTGISIINAEHVTYMAAATPFLNDICDAVAEGAPMTATLRSFLCGGAAIPPALIQRADRELDLKACSLWGMTEALSPSLTEPERAGEKSASTDGRVLPGMEMKIVDADGDELPLGETGRLLTRGAQMFIGYYKQPGLDGRGPDGWFDTGDLAYMDDEGYIRINGRMKDVLIRGGENVPVFEIEGLLYKHPAVASVAIVGYPDERLGERACAFVVKRPDGDFDLRIMQAYLDECRVAKQYWPERIEFLDAMPQTVTGKITKHVLRDLALPKVST